MSASYVGRDDNPDEYELLRLVGGNEGEVFQARHTDSVGREWNVAVKLLHRSGASDLTDKQRFDLQYQRDVHRRLHHRGIVPLIDAFEGAPPHRRGQRLEGRCAYLVTEWATGDTFYEWIRREPSRDPLERLQPLRQVAAALDYMHLGTDSGAPVVHRDVKPSNLIVRDGEGYLIDFGLAAGLVLGRVRRKGLGTPGYIAPELFGGADPTPESDRFAFGGVVFFALTGSDPPERSKDQRKVLRSTSWVRERPGLSDHLMRLLSQRPQDRSASLARWLNELLGPSSTLTESERSALAGALQPVRRRRIWALTPVLLLALALAGAAAWRTSSDRPVAAPSASSTLPRTDMRPPPTPTPSSVETQTPVAATPKFVGENIHDAIDEIKALGATVSTRETLDTKRKDGTIIDQDPRAGSPLPTMITLTVARRPAVTYLDDLEPVSSTPAGGYDDGAADIGGTTYLHSFFGRMPNCSGLDFVSIDFNLGRKFRRFHATAGLRDDSEATARIHFDVRLDGRSVWSSTKGLGSGKALSFDVRGVLRLQLVATRISGPSRNCLSRDSAYVWGNARVTSSPPKLPTTR